MYYNSDLVVPELEKVVGWKDHYDTNEIPSLGVSLNNSTSGEFFNQFHPAMRLDIIKATLPQNRNLVEFLTTIRKDSITELLNDISTDKMAKQSGKGLLSNTIVLDKVGFHKDTIVNNSRFVGFAFTPSLDIGLDLVIKSLGMQFSQPQTKLKIYVYHTSRTKEIQIIEIDTDENYGWSWNELDLRMSADSKEYKGGQFLIGYYQDDLVGQAVNYDKMDWIEGPCGSCDGGISRKRWRGVHELSNLTPFYVPAQDLDPNRLLFDLDKTNTVSRENFGFNFSFNVECNLTNFFIENKKSFKNAIQYKTVIRILEEMKYSNQLNSVEERIRMMILRDLEGDIQTKSTNMYNRMTKAIKAIQFDHSKLSQPCLPGIRQGGVKYGVS